MKQRDRILSILFNGLLAVVLVATLPTHWQLFHGQHDQTNESIGSHLTCGVHAETDHVSDGDSTPPPFSPAKPDEHHHKGFCVFCHTMAGAWQAPLSQPACLIFKQSLACHRNGYVPAISITSCEMAAPRGPPA